MKIILRFRKNKTFILLFLIFLLALFLRLYHLGNLPSTFHEDEVLSGYLGRFIFSNGKDLYGNSWPLLYFNKFGDYYIILPMYLSGISTFLFGINEFATRFPVALFGSLAVFPVFIFAKWIFKNKTIGLSSAFIIAVMPWQIVLSRSTTEGVIGSTIFIIGILFLLRSIKNLKIKDLLTAFFLFFISYFIYHPFRVYSPLVFLPCFFLFKNIRKNKRYFVSFLIGTIFFFSLSYYISTTFWGKGRFVQTSIFSDLSGVKMKLAKLVYDEGQNKVFLAKLFHNKPVGYSYEFIKQYLTYFSPIFLAVNGWDKSRYTVPEQGPLFVSFLVLTLIALVSFPVRDKKHLNKNYLWYLFYLLFIAPLPAAFTVAESPNVHRSIFMTIPLSILIGYGLVKSVSIKWKRLSLSYFLISFLLLESIFFWHQYSNHMDTYASLQRNDGQKQVALFAIKKEKEYDQIVLPAEGAMSWYYLFFKKDFNPNYIGRFKLDARIETTNKIRYIDNSCPTTILQPKDYLNKKILIIDRHDCLPIDRFKEIDSVQGVNPIMAYKVLVPNNQ